MRVILMGTGPFAVPSFESIYRSDHEIAVVVTKPEPPVKSRKGPPPAPVRQWATEHALPILDPSSINEPQAVDQIKRHEADVLVVCDYGQILKPDALSAARLGGINLHGSILPAYRGAAPVQRALLSGDRQTGVSVIHMTPRLDGGPILGVVETEIDDDETAGELEERLSKLGVELTLRSLDLISQWDGISTIGQPQDSAKVTKAPRLSKAEARIDWSKSTRQIDCLIRGMQPWPIAYFEVKVRENKPPIRISVLSASAADCDLADLAPGEINGEDQLIVKTGDGAIRLDCIRPAGKREMSDAEFLRGHQLARGTKLM